MRPDISVNNFSPFEAKLCLDVTVRSTLTEEILFKFFMKGLSVVLHRSIARSIQHKVPRLNVQGPIDGTFLHILDEEPIS